MRILVTFAVDSEFAPWRKIRRFGKASAANMDYHSTEISGAEVDVFLTGVGGKSGWLGAASAICGSEIDVCISSGFAGGLRPEHGIGQILVAEKVLSARRDIVASSESSLIACAVSAGAKRVPFFCTADRVVLHAAEKLELARFGDAVEMESFGVLKEAGMFAGRTVAVRAISDTADEDLPLDFNRVTNDTGDVSIKRVLGEVASAPGSIPALIRFAKRSKLAAESLANFLERFLAALVAQSRSASVGPGQ